MRSPCVAIRRRGLFEGAIEYQPQNSKVNALETIGFHNDRPNGERFAFSKVWTGAMVVHLFR